MACFIPVVVVLSNLWPSCSSQLFNVAIKHEHSARMQFGIFFLTCAAFRAADAFCPVSFRMAAQTERFPAGNTNNKQECVHVSDAVCNRPRTATTAAAVVSRAEGMTRASLIHIMGAAATVSLGISVAPPTAAAARSTEELVSLFMSFVLTPHSSQQLNPHRTHKKEPT